MKRAGVFEEGSRCNGLHAGTYIYTATVVALCCDHIGRLACTACTIYAIKLLWLYTGSQRVGLVTSSRRQVVLHRFMPLLSLD